MSPRTAPLHEPSAAGSRGLHWHKSLMLACLLAWPALASASDPLPPAPPSGVSLRPYYLLPFFPFLWPASPVQPLAPAGQYPFVIWLPAPVPAVPIQPPVAPEQAAAGVTPPPLQAETPAQEAAALQPPPEDGQAPALQDLTVPSQPSLQEAPAAATQPAPARRAARLPTRATGTARQPTPKDAAPKRKLCWKEGRLDVCK